MGDVSFLTGNVMATLPKDHVLIVASEPDGRLHTVQMVDGNPVCRPILVGGEAVSKTARVPEPAKAAQTEKKGPLPFREFVDKNLPSLKYVIFKQIPSCTDERVEDILHVAEQLVADSLERKITVRAFWGRSYIESPRQHWQYEVDFMISRQLAEAYVDQYLNLQPVHYYQPLYRTVSEAIGGNDYLAVEMILNGLISLAGTGLVTDIHGPGEGYHDHLVFRWDDKKRVEIAGRKVDTLAVRVFRDNDGMTLPDAIKTIRAGNVRVNGEQVTEAGIPVTDEDEVIVVKPEDRTVFEDLKSRYPDSVYTVEQVNYLIDQGLIYIHGDYGHVSPADTILSEGKGYDIEPLGEAILKHPEQYQYYYNLRSPETSKIGYVAKPLRLVLLERLGAQAPVDHLISAGYVELNGTVITRASEAIKMDDIDKVVIHQQVEDAEGLSTEIVFVQSMDAAKEEQDALLGHTDPVTMSLFSIVSKLEPTIKPANIKRLIRQGLYAVGNKVITDPAYELNTLGNVVRKITRKGNTQP